MHTIGHVGMHGPGMHETIAHFAGMQAIGTAAVMRIMPDSITGDGGGRGGAVAATWPGPMPRSSGMSMPSSVPGMGDGGMHGSMSR